MPSWLPGHGHLAPAEAAKLVRTGRALEHLPAVAAAFTAGTITAGQAAEIAKVAAPDNLAAAATQGVDLAEVDAALAVVAATQPHAELAQVVTGYLARLDPDGPRARPTEGRRLSIVRHADGSRSIRGELDAVGGEKVEAAVEALLQAGRGAGEDRTRPAAGRRLGAAGRQRPGRREPAGAAP